MKTKPIAVLCSDIHLSLTQPACRADKNWLDTQAHYLKQVQDLAGENGLVFCAGDVFHQWNPPAELINFAIQNLPALVISVPGQHDLPNHRIEEVHRSGYGVLAECSRVYDLTSDGDFNCPKTPNGMTVRGFGWNQPVEGPDDNTQDFHRVAVIHRYCWTKGHSFPGAPESGNVKSYRKALRGYTLAVFGDNHSHFIADLDDCKVVNCGTLIRRRADEIEYQPSVGLLYEDGTVKRHKLDTSIDRFHENAKEREETPLNMQDFLRQLEGLGEHGLDFREAVMRELKSGDIDPKVREIIVKMMESKNEQ